MKMAKTCPSPIDIQDLQFKLHCRLKIFDNSAIETFPKSHSLLSCASRYGLLFVGTNGPNLQVIQLKSVEDYSPKNKDIADYPRRTCTLPSQPRHISVNCDCTVIAVVIEKENCPVVLFYEVTSFLKQNLNLIKEIRLSATPNIYVTEINWNPTIPGIFTACKSDGSLGVYELKGNSVDINELPSASGATCFCWSPRGKQIAVGSSDGNITQYKPDLKAVKVIKPPALPKPHSLISLQWVSTFQFIGVYLSNDDQASVIVVDAPKTGEPAYTNYEDICYSGSSRHSQFYMILQQQWNILMVASSNGTEVSVLGNSGDSWTQWIMPDSVRPELPLSSEHQDTLPLGITLDTSSTKRLPWGESTIPPAPLFIILSHHGLLCVFNLINLKPGAPNLCSAPDMVQDLTGLQFFVNKVNEVKVSSDQGLITIPKFTMSPLLGTKTSTVTLEGVKSSQNPISLFGGQTVITPIDKQATTTSAPAISANKYSSIFSTLNTPTKPIPTQMFAPEPSKVEIVPPKTVEQQPTPTNVNAAAVQAETDAMLAKMIKEECISLESELKALLHRSSLLKIDFGTDDEKCDMVHSIDNLQEFIDEIVDISVSQNGEVHYLKQNLIQSWAWYEEARSRYNATKDEALTVLLKVQPLDSASEKHLKNIQHSMYYLESQLSQASKALDEQWDNFQISAKKIHRNQMPTMETIFQSMVRQIAIIEKQRYVLKDISSRLKTKSRSALLVNANLLEEKMSELSLEPQNICQMQFEKIINRNKLSSKTKTDKLRNLLKKRDVLHITAIKPSSPANRSKHLISILGAQMSPVCSKPSVAKTLDFVQSTPIREIPSNSGFIPVSKIPSSNSLFGTNIPTQSFSAFAPTAPSISSTSGIKPKTETLTVTSTSNIPSSESSTPFACGVTKFGAIATTASSIKNTFNFNSPGTTTTTVTSKPLFNISTTASAIKNSNPVTSVTTPSIFGSVKPNLFSNLNKENDLAKPFHVISTETSDVKPPQAISTTATSIFGKNQNDKIPKSIFVAPTSVPIVSSIADVSPSSGTTPKTTSMFSTTPTTSIFGSTQTTGIFGGTTTAAVEPLFNTQTTTTVTNAFSSTTTKTVFGTGNSIFSSTQTPLFPSKTSESIVSTTPGSSFSFVSAVAQSNSVFGNKTTSVSTPSTPTETNSVNKSSIFDKVVSTSDTISQKPVFVAPSTATSDNTTQKSLFSVPSTATSDNTTQKSLFSVPSTATSDNTTQKPLFTVPSTGSSSVFGSAAVPDKPSDTATTSSPFGSNPTTSLFNTTKSTTPMFGGTTKDSIFSSVPLTIPKFGSPTTSSIFGGSVTSTATTAIDLSAAASSTKTIFGSTTTGSTFGVSTTSATPSVFNSTTSAFGTVTTTQSIFGSTSSPFNTTTSATSIFGNSGTPIFGTPTTSSTPSIFGTPTTAFGTTATSTTVFEANKPTSSVFSMNQSVFSATPTTTASVFGQQTTSSVFGTPATTANTPFGGGAASPPFGSGNSVFGTPFGGNSSTSQSIFGAASTTQSSSFSFTAAAGQNSNSNFSFNSLSVGNSGEGSVFGSNFGQTPAVNPFGKTSTKSIFDNTPTTTSTTSIFVSNSNSPFASPNTFGASAPSSEFGQQPAFGQSAFGSGNTFGSPQPGPFSGGGSGVAQTGFGSPTTFPKQNVFGAAPVFGGAASPSAFGSSPSFGGAPTFGSSPTFGGSPNKVFGSNTPTGNAAAFGAAASPQNSSFGNLANQNTVGFGSLAQQAATPNPSPFSGGSSFSSWR